MLHCTATDSLEAWEEAAKHPRTSVFSAQRGEGPGSFLVLAGRLMRKPPETPKSAQGGSGA